MDKLQQYLIKLAQIEVNLADYQNNIRSSEITHNDKQVFTFNGYHCYIDYLNSIWEEEAWVDSYIEDIVVRCQEKYKAQIFIEDVTFHVKRVKSNFEIANDPLHNTKIRGKMIDPIEKIKNQNIAWAGEIEIGVSGYPNSSMDKVRNAILNISKVQLECLLAIEESIEHWKKKIERIPNTVDWKKNDLFEILPPPITIDKNHRLTNTSLKLSNPLDKYQMVLLYHYFEQNQVFYKDFSNKDKAWLLYLLSSHNEQDLRDNLAGIPSIKDDTHKNKNKKKEKLHNLNSIKKVIEKIRDEIISDIEKHS